MVSLVVGQAAEPLLEEPVELLLEVLVELVLVLVVEELLLVELLPPLPPPPVEAVLLQPEAAARERAKQARPRGRRWGVMAARMPSPRRRGNGAVRPAPGAPC
jgi:hypothetical protein